MNKIAAIKEVHHYFDGTIALSVAKDAIDSVGAFRGIQNPVRVNDFSEAHINDAIYWVNQQLHRKRYTSPDKAMTVTVTDTREFPVYKSVQITTLFREMLNGSGIDWDKCIALGKKFQEAIEDADYLSDDVGRTWAKSFVPSKGG